MHAICNAEHTGMVMLHYIKACVCVFKCTQVTFSFVDLMPMCSSARKLERALAKLCLGLAFPFPGRPCRSFCRSLQQFFAGLQEQAVLRNFLGVNKCWDKHSLPCLPLQGHIDQIIIIGSLHPKVRDEDLTCFCPEHNSNHKGKGFHACFDTFFEKDFRICFVYIYI